MNIRPVESKDIEPLHALYNSLAARLPPQPQVSLEQFAEQLLTCTWTPSERRHWPKFYPNERSAAYVPEEQIALVATQNGSPVAFGCGYFINETAEFTPDKTGLIQFLLAEPHHGNECRAIIRALVEHSRRSHNAEIAALTYSHGPVFHNNGCALLSTAWPWLAQWLTEEGFETVYQRLSLRRPITSAPVPLPLPVGAVMHPWEGDSEHSHRLSIKGEPAGECVCYFSERFVRGSGMQSLYVAELHVYEGFRRQGLGRFLLRDALVAAHSAGAREVTLRTEPTNYGALSLYALEGFRADDLLCWLLLRPAG